MYQYQEKINQTKTNIRKHPEILSCVNILNRRHKWIFEARFAGMTLERCGMEFGVTRERIRQIEKKILNQLIKELYDERSQSHDREKSN